MPDPLPPPSPVSSAALDRRPEPAARRRRGWVGPFALGALGGLVVAAAVGLAIGGSGDDDEVDTEPIELPDELRGYRAASDVVADLGPAGSGERYERIDQRTGEAVSEAYGGAAASARTYADDGAEQIFQAIAVRAESPGLLAPNYASAEDLGLAVPIDEIQTFGDVQCVVRNPPTPAGQDVDEEQVVAALCQRTEEELTVRTQPGIGVTPSTAARIVDDLWGELTE